MHSFEIFNQTVALTIRKIRPYNECIIIEILGKTCAQKEDIMKGNLLIVDDKDKLYESLAQIFEPIGYKTFYARNTHEAISAFREKSVHVVLLDIMLGEESGLECLKKLRKINKNIPVIMITGYASIDSAVESMKIGAYDYVKKPLDFEHLLKIVENAMKLFSLSEENEILKDRIIEFSPKICFINKQMIELHERAKKLASTELPILIVGENGTGKEMLADFIHTNSRRNTRKMQKINCASFPEGLLDNELFGHEKGAYTGADTQFQGIFERANKSTLFLDEIGDMPLSIQAKILRVLQNNEVRRLGGKETLNIDVRFIAATNKDLDEMKRNNQFREDLYYRLNTAIITIPPLRERKEDIPVLADFFLNEYAALNSLKKKTLSDTVLDVLISYHWPGNVRELKNTISYACAISSGDVIGKEDLPPIFNKIEAVETTGNIREEMEKMLIIKTLQKMNYNKRKAAEMLDMSRNTLYSKIEKYGIL